MKSLNISNLLPAYLREKLDSFRHRADAEQLFELLVSIVINGSREFTSEWTDHGIVHLQEVLYNAVGLISESASEKLTPEDVFTLITSVLLHDIALTLTEEQVEEAVRSGIGSYNGLSQKWITFCSEMRRWSPTQVTKVYGPHATVPRGFDIIHFRSNERFVVGEFLRRYHGEFILPLVDGDFRFLAPNSSWCERIKHAPKDFRLLLRLSGIIAASHTTSLRQGVELVQSMFGLSHEQPSSRHTLMNTHYAYVMAALRLGDHLGFRNATPSPNSALEKATPPKGVMLQMEAATLSAFVEVVWDYPSESVHLRYATESEDVERQFKSYCYDLQSELDLAWAVLSEQYSSDGGLRIFATSGLTVRRVQASNLLSFVRGKSEQTAKTASEGGDKSLDFFESPRVFISYCWEPDEDKVWAEEFAKRLVSNGIQVYFDVWVLYPGDEIALFMERAVRENDFVLILCTPSYKHRSDNRRGGVGYEGHIMTAEIVNGAPKRKFIPLLKSGTWLDAVPLWLTGTFGYDFTSEPYGEDNYWDLVMTLYGLRPASPPLGPRPSFFE